MNKLAKFIKIILYIPIILITALLVTIINFFEESLCEFDEETIDMIKFYIVLVCPIILFILLAEI